MSKFVTQKRPLGNSRQRARAIGTKIETSPANARERASERESERDGVPTVSRHIYSRGQNTIRFFLWCAPFGVLIYVSPRSSKREQAGESSLFHEKMKRKERGRKKKEKKKKEFLLFVVWALDDWLIIGGGLSSVMEEIKKTVVWKSLYSWKNDVKQTTIL